MNALTVLAKGPAMLSVLARSWLWQRIMKAPDIELQQGCQILGHRHIHIGPNFRAGRLLWLEAVTEFGEKKFTPALSIGGRVSCSDGVHIACAIRVTIGNDVLIGSKVHITDHNHGSYRGSAPHSSPDVPPAQRVLTGAPVDIGDRVFLADGVVVLPGSIIGAGTVVGANAVVSGTLPPDSICAGTPARPIKTFDHVLQRWQSVGMQPNHRATQPAGQSDQTP
jgi:acetyltransferase-like isoleucine patch superfamily enzyme